MKTERPVSAFFGGSFNPPHSGHRHIVETVLAARRCQTVLVAPTARPPHRDGDALAPFADRLAMVKLAFGDLPQVQFCDIEQKLPQKYAYSLDMLDILSAQNSETEFVLVIGGDSLRDLPTWHEAVTLVQKYRIWTVPRPEVTPDLAQLQKVWPPDLAQKLFDGILPAVANAASATMVRKNLTKGLNHIGEIDQRVLSYINAHHLYQGAINK